METGIVSETKYGKTRTTEIKTSLIATCNNTKNLSTPLLSRFFTVELEPYAYDEFLQITKQLLSRYKIEEAIAEIIAKAVWITSRDIRDCVKTGALAKSILDVNFLVDNFFGPKKR